MGGESRTYTAAGLWLVAMGPFCFLLSAAELLTGLDVIGALSAPAAKMPNYLLFGWARILLLAPTAAVLGVTCVQAPRRLKYILNDDGITATEGQVHLPWQGAKLVLPQNRFWSLESTKYHTVIGADGRKIVIRRTFKDFDKLIADISARVPVE